MKTVHAMTQQDLDKVRCATPNCTHDHSTLVLAPKCHRYGKVEAVYNKPSGALTIRCAKCQEHVATIAVAAAPAMVQ